MRWKDKKAPELGDSRIVRRFLILPTSIDGETRWLEWAVIRQINIGLITVVWSDAEWIDA